MVREHAAVTRCLNQPVAGTDHWRSCLLQQLKAAACCTYHILLGLLDGFCLSVL